MMDVQQQSTYEEGGDAGFFERERNRLIQDISKGVESILGNSNALNRKLEESISVGKEFHPIAELWSKFERVMVASGIPNLHPQNVAATAKEPNTAGGVAEDKESTPKEELKFDLGTATSTANLPPGVAPGGGRIYA